MSKSSAQAAHARLGLWLCAIYGTFYACFVFVSAFAPAWVAWQPVAGLNLALLWGFALIALACILAVAYGMFCKPEEDDSATEPSRESE